jgi:hypothetical protein
LAEIEPISKAELMKSFDEGRAEEVLEVGGVTVHPMQFALVTADPDVREFQVVQEGDALRLRVALRNGAADAPARLRERVCTRLHNLGRASTRRRGGHRRRARALARREAADDHAAGRVIPQVAPLKSHIRPRRTDI